MTTTYTDRHGHEWDLALNVATIRRVKADTEVDLCSEDVFHLGIDRLADVLLSIVRPQLQAAGVTDDDFWSGLSGESLEAATVALLYAVVDFTPPQKRPALQAVIDRALELERQSIEQTVQHINEIDLESLSKVEAA